MTTVHMYDTEHNTNVVANVVAVSIVDGFFMILHEAGTLWVNTENIISLREVEDAPVPSVQSR